MSPLHCDHAVAQSSPDPGVQPQAFGFMGFLVAVLWIYIVANEIVNLLQVNRVACLPAGT